MFSDDIKLCRTLRQSVGRAELSVSTWFKMFELWQEFNELLRDDLNSGSTRLSRKLPAHLSMVCVYSLYRRLTYNNFLHSHWKYLLSFSFV